MITGEGNVVCVSFKSGDERLGGVVPDLDGSLIDMLVCRGIWVSDGLLTSSEVVRR